jgi:type II secretory pathway pseudopilin PulG
MRILFAIEKRRGALMKTNARKNREQGISLVELMIVTALLGLVMAGIYNMFVHQQKSYAVQDNVSSMQQNARVGLEYMVKHIRMAGYIPESIPFDPDDPPVPAPLKSTPPLADVAGQPFTDGNSEAVEEATAHSITFLADIDNDARTETVRYALNGTDLTMEVWRWNASTSTWGNSTGPQIIAQEIENLVFTYALLADDHGLNNDIDDDGNEGADEEGEIKIWNFATDGVLGSAERRHIRQVSVNLTVRSATRDPVYRDPVVGDSYRRRTLTSNINLRNIT